MNKELQAILPGFGKAIEPHLCQYLTSNKEVSTRYALFMAGLPAAGKTEQLPLRQRQRSGPHWRMIIVRLRSLYDRKK